MWVGWRLWDGSEDGVPATSRLDADRIYTERVNDPALEVVVMLDQHDSVIQRHER
jgi:hypothetical protein